MAPTKLKYNLNHYIGILPRHVSIEAIVEVLGKEYGISRDTFYRDRALTIHDDFSIPSDRLDIYAGLLGVKADDLKNYSQKKIKPIAERDHSALAKTIIKKAKLTRGK